MHRGNIVPDGGEEGNLGTAKLVPNLYSSIKEKLLLHKKRTLVALFCVFCYSQYDCASWEDVSSLSLTNGYTPKKLVLSRHFSLGAEASVHTKLMHEPITVAKQPTNDHCFPSNIHIVASQVIGMDVAFSSIEDVSGYSKSSIHDFFSGSIPWPGVLSNIESYFNFALSQKKQAMSIDYLFMCHLDEVSEKLKEGSYIIGLLLSEHDNPHYVLIVAIDQEHVSIINTNGVEGAMIEKIPRSLYTDRGAFGIDLYGAINPSAFIVFSLKEKKEQDK